MSEPRPKPVGRRDETGVWIFAYGSLMWRPDFAFLEQRRARLLGYHRSLCVYSWVWRGTKEAPGLVLGLDRGGSCTGVAFRVAPADEADVLALLDARELVTAVYRRRRVRLVTSHGPLEAWAYVVRREHEQYAGVLDVEASRLLIAGASGRGGPNRDYLLSTVEHLRGMGIRDRLLEAAASGLGGTPAERSRPRRAPAPRLYRTRAEP